MQLSYEESFEHNVLFPHLLVCTSVHQEHQMNKADCPQLNCATQENMRRTSPPTSPAPPVSPRVQSPWSDLGSLHPLPSSSPKDAALPRLSTTGSLQVLF